MLHRLGANITPQTILRASKSIGAGDSICTAFEHSLHIQPASESHTPPDDSKDFEMALETLMETNVFTRTHGRTHRTFEFQRQFLRRWQRVRCPLDPIIAGKTTPTSLPSEG